MGEVFDVYDEDERWIGTAERGDVHALGLWHRTFHCWLARTGDDGEARVLFQLRSAGKDTNPGRYDITAAGHLVAGESPRDAVRELEEELGVAVGFEQLIAIGTVREHLEGTIAGRPYIDREISDVYCCISDWNLSSLRLQEEEVAGVYEARASELIALMRGEASELPARGVALHDGRLEASDAIVTKADFVPRKDDYYIDVFHRLAELAGRASP
ncbi:NUDIX domain-containing protein [Cohnella sp. GCM10027633]|uniref:NUDIX hydrolase n=1 Tax=unclassified Cohnella TaxID=2636738 RepID=UPI00363F90BE